MGSRLLAGIEVPITGSDSVKWVEVSVPSHATPTSTAPPLGHPTQDAASCSLIGDPPTYLTWRIHKSQPNVLELLELCTYEEFPRIGLRIVFPTSLCPFSFICKNEIGFASGNLYQLYALTISGFAYLFRLKSFSAYVSCSVFTSNELIEFDLRTYSNDRAITALAATAGCLVIGRNDGSVGCFHLGMLDQNAPGFAHELQDDSGIGRLWSLMSRGTIAGAVQDLVILDMHGKKLVFVLHFNGILRVWDLLNHSKVFSHMLSVPALAGGMFAKLWVGETNFSTSIIPLAILYRGSLDVSSEMISIYSLHFSWGDKVSLLLEPSIQNIPFDEGRLVDVYLTSNKIWILKENGLSSHSLLLTGAHVEETHSYVLQEAFVADLLFQSSESSIDELLWTIHSIFSFVKDQVVPFISSIFLRRLLHPGVLHNIVLRATFLDYNKHWTDSEFLSLTSDALKNEILSLIEHEGVHESLTSIFYHWKNFTSRYFHNWCERNSPQGFLVDASTGAVGIIRKNSLSVFRSLENIELMTYGSFDEFGDFVNSGLGLSADLSSEIRFGMFHCISSINQQLGKAASAVLYESLVSMPILSFEEIVPCLLKMLEAGCSSSIALHHASDLGADIAWEKELAEHKNLRKFSVDMLLSVNALYSKATTWRKVLDIIQSYLEFLVPGKNVQSLDYGVVLNVQASIMLQATSQVAKVMFEAAFNMLLLLSYLVNISGQIHMSNDDINCIQLELVPMIQEIVTEWLVVHFLGTTPSESPAVEDFSSQLSSLQIDSNISKRSWKEKLGKCDFTLAFILLLNSQSSSGVHSLLSLRCLPSPQNFICSIRDFASWIVWGKTGEESSTFFSHATNVGLILLRHGQYPAVECVLSRVNSHLCKEKVSESNQTDGEWCILFHLLGCCLLGQAHSGLHGMLKERKVCEAVRCFFRASSGQGGSKALQRLSYEAGLPYLGFTGCMSGAIWKLQYYQWAMQMFEQYGLSEAACQFALAALEQVDEALGPTNDIHGEDFLNESANTVKGRLWSNVFKFTLDLNHLNDAYCAIISNPDDESKYICLRRFIIVLYEHGAIQILCGGQVPFIGLTDKVEQELAWKAERSDISTQPNPYKLLYAFEMYRHNWQKAAGHIYQYSAHLKTEAALKDYQYWSLALQERLSALSASINALHLVHPTYAWIDPLCKGSSLQKEHHRNKKAKKSVEDQTAGSDFEPEMLQSCIDVDKLEKEFILTSAEYLLSLANVKWTSVGIEKLPSDLVDLLIEMNLYDMAFTVLLKFWKDSGLKREMERVFTTMSLKCCPSKAGSSLVGTDFSAHGLLLTSSKDETVTYDMLDSYSSSQEPTGKSQWETLELYLEKYRGFHPNLPMIIAETLLRMDSLIELPLWLVNMFKAGQRESLLGMAGQESNPASLFQLYVNYGRYTEATNLLLEYIELLASVRPANIVHRKSPSAVWFPYTAIERLWCRVEELITRGHMIDQYDNLKRLLRGALLRHLELLNLDSDDALSSAIP